MAHWSPLSFAIYRNSVPLVHRVLQVARRAAIASNLDPDFELQLFFVADSVARPRPDRPDRSLPCVAHLHLAVTLGRVEILEVLMKTLSFGIPYFELVEKDATQQEKLAAKHYRGLSVRGKKKGEWLNASFPAHSARQSDREKKLLHRAAYDGNVASLRWLQSARPWQCLQEYIASNQGTKHVRLLQGDNPQQLLEKGLGIGTPLLPHLVIRGWQSSATDDRCEPEIDTCNSKEALLYLLAQSPDAIEAKTSLGLTPALFAIREGKPEAISALVDAGANFFARDSDGRNILHQLLTPKGEVFGHGAAAFKSTLALLPADAVATAWTQRTSSTGQTPLARYISVATVRQGLDKEVDREFLSALLEASGGVGLTLADHAGNLPIHELMIRGRYLEALMVLRHAPELVAVENGDGRTPPEILEASWKRQIVGGFPYGQQAAFGSNGLYQPSALFQASARIEPELPALPPAMWDVLKGRQIPLPEEGGEAKAVSVEAVQRKLVELETARGVARRVCGIAKHSGFELLGNIFEVDNDYGDVVALW